MGEYVQIGEVAERARLSLRTIRHYEETGLVRPATRSPGGFRLYSEADVDRLLLLRQAKPLGFSLEELRELLAVLDALAESAEGSRERAALLERLAMFREAAQARVQALHDELEMAESFAALLEPNVGSGRATRDRATW